MYLSAGLAEGAPRGAPQAIQIADRWHLWHNLGEAAEKCVYRHCGCLRLAPERPEEPAEEAEPAASSPWPTGHRFAERTRPEHATIHALDAYKPYLAQRWQEGCTNAWKLWEEIREQGYPDGYGNVRNHVSRTLRRKPQPVGPESTESARASADSPSLSRFAHHLERDLDAVVAGLSPPWNSGAVEGHVNRIKMLKRQIFGRAGFDLLRKRALSAK